MPTYECLLCNYSTKIKTHYKKHLQTEKHKLKSIKEIAKPESPTITIFFLPIESLNDPHIGLRIIQAKAEVAKIEPIWISFKPRSRAIGGIVIKTID